MSVPVESASVLQNAVRTHLLQVLGAAPLQSFPFTHFYLENVFPEDTYRQMLARLPPAELHRPLSPQKHRRPDGTSTRDIFELREPFLAKLPEPDRGFWSAIEAALTSAELKRLLFRRFASDLARRFKVTPEEAVDIEAHPRPALIRDLGGYQISPHPDSPSKIVTLQFYLPPDRSQLDLGTSLYRIRILQLSNLIRPWRPFELARRLPFSPNSGYGFPVTRWSWHGRERVPLASQPRVSLLNIYYTDPSRAY